MNRIARILCLFLCIALISGFVGCGAKQTVSPVGVDLRATLSSLVVRDDALGLAGKYSSVSEIKNGSVDPALIGTWRTADESESYTYSKEGVLTFAWSEDDSVTDAPFTCITANGHNILCTDLPITNYLSDGSSKQSTVLRYTAYLVQNDTLYYVDAESASEKGNTATFSLTTAYKTDDKGSIAESAAKSRISPSTLYGTWKASDGQLQFRFDENGLVVTGDDANYGQKPLAVSFNDMGQLVVKAGKGSTAYDVALSYKKTYMDEDRENVDSDGFALTLSYTGANRTDKPNLADVLTDWKTEYGYDQWIYSVNLTLAE